MMISPFSLVITIKFRPRSQSDPKGMEEGNNKEGNERWRMRRGTKGREEQES